MKQYRAFTLVEVLIAILLLGVIGTFTIPKLLQTVNDNQEILVLKETYAELNAVLIPRWQQGPISLSDFQSVFFDRVNPLKVCQSNALSEGCWQDSSTDVASVVNVERQEPAFILPNGAILTGFDACCDRTTTDATFSSLPAGVKINGIIIDGNGNQGPNELGEDQLALVINYGTVPYVAGSVTIPPASIQPNPALTQIRITTVNNGRSGGYRRSLVGGEDLAANNALFAELVNR